jgi:hypothetical protein
MRAVRSCCWRDRVLVAALLSVVMRHTRQYLLGTKGAGERWVGAGRGSRWLGDDHSKQVREIPNKWASELLL